MVGRSGTEWEAKGIAVAGYTVAVICKLYHQLYTLLNVNLSVCIASNKYSLMFSNVVGAVKVLTLILFVGLSPQIILMTN